MLVVAPLVGVGGVGVGVGVAWGAVGEVAHRAAFHVLAALPLPVSVWVRGRVFDTLFRSGSPWNYLESRFERRKREWLLSAIPSSAATIVEVGTANGHNLVPMSDVAPNARIVGVDISQRAVRLARVSTLGHPRIEVEQSDASSLVRRHADLAGAVDVLVLSEVLYYMGAGNVLFAGVRPLHPLLAPGATVVMMHGGADAWRLHEVACRALGVRVIQASTAEIDDTSVGLVIARKDAHA